MESAKTKPQKPHKLRKKILKALLILAVLIVIALSALLYCPVRTMATLEKVDDFPLYTMKYHGESRCLHISGYTEPGG